MLNVLGRRARHVELLSSSRWRESCCRALGSNVVLVRLLSSRAVLSTWQTQSQPPQLRKVQRHMATTTVQTMSLDEWMASSSSSPPSSPSPPSPLSQSPKRRSGDDKTESRRRSKNTTSSSQHAHHSNTIHTHKKSSMSSHTSNVNVKQQQHKQQPNNHHPYQQPSSATNEIHVARTRTRRSRSFPPSSPSVQQQHQANLPQQLVNDMQKIVSSSSAKQNRQSLLSDADKTTHHKSSSKTLKQLYQQSKARLHKPTYDTDSSKTRAPVNNDENIHHVKQQKPNDSTEQSNRKKFKSINVSQQRLDALEALSVGWRKGRSRPHIVKYKDWEYVRSHTPWFRRKLQFKAAAKTSTSFLPSHPGVKEVCFIGRSNVGKSSLINAITRSVSARMGDKPGVTQTVNFYSLEKSSINIVDLPGYGFAFGKQDTVQEFQNTANEYIATRNELRRVFVLLDARLPFKFVDQQYISNLLDVSSKRPFKVQVVLTKCDLVDMATLARRQIVIEEFMEAFPKPLKVLTVSSLSCGGMVALREAICDATGLGRKKENTTT